MSEFAPISKSTVDRSRKSQQKCNSDFFGKQMLGRLILALPTAVTTYFATKFGIDGLSFSAIWPLVAALAIWLMMALILPSC